MQGEDPAHPGQRARADRVDGAAGHQLLGGLEDQPQRNRQFRHPRQRQRGSQQDRGMRVVAAGVRRVGHGRFIRGTGPLGHRQRVHVGAQRDPRFVFGAEIAGQPRPAGQHLRVEPHVGQPFGDELCGGVFLAAQLRVAVEVPPPGDQVIGMLGQPRIGDIGEAHDATRWSRAVSTRSRSSADSARRTTVRANMIAPVDDRPVGAGTDGCGGEPGLVQGRAAGIDSDHRMDSQADVA